MLLTGYRLTAQVWAAAERGKLCALSCGDVCIFELDLGTDLVYRKQTPPSCKILLVSQFPDPIHQWSPQSFDCAHLSIKKIFEHAPLIKVYLFTCKLYTCTTVLMLCMVQNKN